DHRAIILNVPPLHSRMVVHLRQPGAMLVGAAADGRGNAGGVALIDDRRRYGAAMPENRQAHGFPSERVQDSKYRHGQWRSTVAPDSPARSAKAKASAGVNAAATDRGPSVCTTSLKVSSRQTVCAKNRPIRLRARSLTKIARSAARAILASNRTASSSDK